MESKPCRPANPEAPHDIPRAQTPTISCNCKSCMVRNYKPPVIMHIMSVHGDIYLYSCSCCTRCFSSLAIHFGIGEMVAQFSAIYCKITMFPQSVHLGTIQLIAKCWDGGTAGRATPSSMTRSRNGLVIQYALVRNITFKEAWIRYAQRLQLKSPPI